MIIYRFISPSGKSYIGQTKAAIEIRWNQHIQLWQRLSKKQKYKNFNVKLFNAFDKYPEEFWTKEILYKCSSKEEMNEKEIYFIREYDTYYNGYNSTKGGDGRIVDYLEEDHKKNISKARKEYFETQEGINWKTSLSKNFKENNPSKSRREEIREQNSKWYLILDIYDNEIIVKNMSEFRRNNPNKIIQIFPNNFKSKYCTFSDYRCKLLKGYDDNLSNKEKQFLIEQNKKEIKPLKKWFVISPTNETYLIFSLKDFCKDHPELIPQCLGKVALNKTTSYKGWRCKIIN